MLKRSINFIIYTLGLEPYWMTFYVGSLILLIDNLGQATMIYPQIAPWILIAIMTDLVLFIAFLFQVIINSIMINFSDLWTI